MSTNFLASLYQNPQKIRSHLRVDLLRFLAKSYYIGLCQIRFKSLRCVFVSPPTPGWQVEFRVRQVEGKAEAVEVVLLKDSHSTHIPNRSWAEVSLIIRIFLKTVGGIWDEEMVGKKSGMLI